MDVANTVDLNLLKGILENTQTPLYESQLLNKVFTDPVNTFDALELYQCHFLLFHNLYKLQTEYYKESKYLHIHFMRINLLHFPQKGNCRHYDDNLGAFCNTPCEGSYCDFHGQQYDDISLERLSLKYFYLDPSNYDALTKETAESFLRGTWEVLANYEAIEKSRKLLELPQCFDDIMLKHQFRNLTKLCHPDVSPGKEERFKRINNAYRQLLRYVESKK
ncbi:DNA-J related domain-containing protein [Spirochaeta cellobiosiphila]|uniref:DNA-J related domain-containing protein n=1 Tax=Spirochaeta cellobiosiphila TaxID=504483 RepID=UPI000426DDB3|nr:DNA-J related domain-containing protein [Spirochaeta cellobiosiphila]